ncbi:unnamed protein product [Bursaphelenchus xylophilus]|uniref:(pine wood nematode) hypothetical protein n=1 Tax=Bursaphelenchus xylophilus TaxID=6326 RepID=A0A1I7SQW1_BURXY|nr:unnamed protein product [Bursaphelenchus xylophilus]CAG9110473.1 unnamed protein product [Bursaphelenchus xylophilus]
MAEISNATQPEELLHNGELQSGQHINAEATADLRRQLNRSESAGSSKSSKGECRDLYPHTLDATGRDAKIYVNGEVYDGLIEKIEPDMSTKVVYATKDNGDGEQLARGTDLSFKREDISVIKFRVEKPKGFRTDREYNNGTEVNENEELVEWQPDPECDTTEENENNSRGWSVEEMFRANMKLGVKSTFEGVNEKYCTAVPEGDEEARRRAEIIAQEIESQAETQRHYMLENDDEERDLDKETNFNNRGKRGPGYNNGRANRGQPYEAGANNRGGNYGQRQGQGFSNGPGNKYGSPTNRNYTPRQTGRSTAPSGAWRQDSPQQNSFIPPQSYNNSEERYGSTSPGRSRQYAQRTEPPREQHPTVEVQPIPKSPVPTLQKPESLSPTGSSGTAARASPASTKDGSEEKKDKKKFTFNPNAKAFVPTPKLAQTPPLGYIQQVPHMRQQMVVTSVPQSQYQQMPPQHYGGVQQVLQTQVIPIQQSQMMMQQQAQYIPHQPPPSQQQLIQTSLLHQHPQQQYQLQQQQIPLMHQQQGRIQVQHTGLAQGVDLQNAHLQSMAGQQMYIPQQQIVAGVQPYQPGIPPPVVPQSMFNPNQVVYGYGTPGAN